MLSMERQSIIISLLKENKTSVTVNQLTRLFNMSARTVRRDLNILAQKKLLVRSHGGALLSGDEALENIYNIDNAKKEENNGYSESFRYRIDKNQKSKMSIAKIAVKMVSEGDNILLDSSSTSWFLARQLPDIELTVLTNSINVVQTLACRSNIRIISLGGEYSEKFEAFAGPLTDVCLREYRIDKFFFSCHSISINGGLRETNELHARLKNQMIQASNKNILLLDHSKYDRQSFARICFLNDISMLISDVLPERELYSELIKCGVTLHEA